MLAHLAPSLMHISPAFCACTRALAPRSQEAAAASAPGSVLITNLMTESGLENLRRKVAERRAILAAAAQEPAGTAAAGGGKGLAAAAASAAGSKGVKAANGTGGGAGPSLPPRKKEKGQQGGAAGAGAAGGAAGGALAAPLVAGGSSLTDHFQWGCPDNVSGGAGGRAAGGLGWGGAGGRGLDGAGGRVAGAWLGTFGASQAVPGGGKDWALGGLCRSGLCAVWLRRGREILLACDCTSVVVLFCAAATVNHYVTDSPCGYATHASSMPCAR